MAKATMPATERLAIRSAKAADLALQRLCRLAPEWYLLSCNGILFR